MDVRVGFFNLPMVLSKNITVLVENKVSLLSLVWGTQVTPVLSLWFLGGSAGKKDLVWERVQEPQKS